MKPKTPRATGKTAAPRATPAPTAAPALEALLRAEPDLVDRIFDYVVELMPEIAKHRDEVTLALREEFAGETAYIRRRSPVTADALSKAFDGRNVYEVMRVFGLGRATVYRKLKQPGRG